MRTLRNISIEPNIAPGIDLLPLIGETAWHAVTLDTTIADVSKAHFDQLAADLRHLGVLRPGMRILEVAAYAHVAGYMFAEAFDADVALFDVSSSTLRLGRDLAIARGLPIERVRRVAGDFHTLPFRTGEFDVVYISSALHHSWRWRRVLTELVRVTKVGGHLVLENEPCRRELCFYRFRTNRPGDLTPGEAFLDGMGLLRTVAEPYLGSRAELLFGMTENQEIRLADLLGQLALSCELAVLRPAPQICMGSLESALDTALVEKHAGAREALGTVVRSAFARAKEACRESGAQWSALLPDHAHVEAMIEKIQRLLAHAPYGSGEMLIATSGERTPVSADRLGSLLKPLIEKDSSLGRDLDRATLFGAGIKVIASKGTETSGLADPTVAVIDDTGVELRFQPEILSLMDTRNALFPHMQRAPLEDIQHALGPDWNVAIDQNGARVATLVVARPRVLTAACNRTMSSSLLASMVSGATSRGPSGSRSTANADRVLNSRRAIRRCWWHLCRMPLGRSLSSSRRRISARAGYRGSTWHILECSASRRRK